MKKEELLNKYFLDTLTPDELGDFNQLLMDDKEFLEQFKYEKGVKRVIKSKKRDVLVEKVAILEEKLIAMDLAQQESKTNNLEHNNPIKTLNPKVGKQDLKNRFNSSRVWGIAASIAILFSLGYYFYSLNTGSEKLFANNYEKYPNTIHPITKSSQKDDSTELNAFVAYESNQDQKAIILFLELKEEKNFEYIDFFLGQSYLKTNQLEKAIVNFENSISSNKKFSEESRWYLALTYLKKDDKKNALLQLKYIINNNSYKAKKAKTLLEAID